MKYDLTAKDFFFFCRILNQDLPVYVENPYKHFWQHKGMQSDFNQFLVDYKSKGLISCDKTETYSINDDLLDTILCCLVPTVRYSDLSEDSDKYIKKTACVLKDCRVIIKKTGNDYSLIRFKENDPEFWNDLFPDNACAGYEIKHEKLNVTVSLDEMESLLKNFESKNDNGIKQFCELHGIEKDICVMILKAVNSKQCRSYFIEFAGEKRSCLLRGVRNGDCLLMTKLKLSDKNKEAELSLVPMNDFTEQDLF